MRKLTADIEELFPITRVRISESHIFYSGIDLDLEFADGPPAHIAKFGIGHTISRPVTIRENASILKLLGGIA